MKRVSSIGRAKMTSKKQKNKEDNQASEAAPLQLVDAERLQQYKPKKKFKSSFASLLNAYADQLDAEIDRIIRL